MFSILPLFLILLSLGVIVVIVARRYPELTLLDLDSIPERKEKQKKKEIFSRKASQRSKEQQERMRGKMAPLAKIWEGIQTAFRKYVKRLKDDVNDRKHRSRTYGTQSKTAVSSVPQTPPNPVFQKREEAPKEETIDDILKKGERALDQNNPQAAESAFIRAIEKDKKDARAYEGLGDVYMSQEQLAEAEESYLFAHKLAPKHVSILEKLAGLATSREDWESAISYYEQAVLVEDANPASFATLADLFVKAGQLDSAFEAISQAIDILPKNLEYLDMFVEISIMVEDKDRAEFGVNAIRMIDPEYARLDMFRERISDIA